METAIKGGSGKGREKSRLSKLAKTQAKKDEEEEVKAHMEQRRERMSTTRCT